MSTATTDYLADWRSKVPPGKAGDWTVEQFEVTEGVELMRMMFSGRGCRAGTYTRLTRNGRVIMSDTDAEIHDLQPFVRRATGRVLVSGLGLGIVTAALARKDSVEQVTVVERDADVISLVGPHMDTAKVEIVCADIRAFVPVKRQRWDYGWHDIWDDICGDNWPEMQELRRRFCRRVRKQMMWCEAECRRNR